MKFVFKPVLRLAAVGVLATVPSFAVSVGLELSLLVDVSGSITTAEFDLQRTGYRDAFQDAGIQALIAATPGGIAVNLVYWSGTAQQSQVVGWTQLTDAASANAFAAAVFAAPRTYQGNTAPGSALNFAVPLFTNGFEGDRQVIDVSGDGAENEGANTAAARTAALGAGIDQINGLPIGDAALEAWYAANIQGGAGSFTSTATTFADFGDAIHTKLFREITGEVPEPASIVLLGTMLCFAGYKARRRLARG